MRSPQTNQILTCFGYIIHYFPCEKILSAYIILGLSHFGFYCLIDLVVIFGYHHVYALY